MRIVAVAAAAAMVVAAVAAAMEVDRERPDRGEEIGVTRMQVRVPRIHIGDNLRECSNIRVQCMASKHKSICTADQF
jgi:hypothetical protein